MAYEKQKWRNEKEGRTPLNATRMNHIEEGIGDVDERVTNIERHGVAGIVPNPPMEGDEEALNGLQIGDDKYKIVGGGGGDVPSTTVLWANEEKILPRGHVVKSPFDFAIREDGVCCYVEPDTEKLVPLGGGGGRSFDTMKVSIGFSSIDEDGMIFIGRQQGETAEHISLPNDKYIGIVLTNQGSKIAGSLRYDRINDEMVNDEDIATKMYVANYSAYGGGIDIVEVSITKRGDREFSLYWSKGSNYGTVTLEFDNRGVTAKNSYWSNTCDFFEFRRKEN